MAAEEDVASSSLVAALLTALLPAAVASAAVSGDEGWVAAMVELYVRTSTLVELRAVQGMKPQKKGPF